MEKITYSPEKLKKVKSAISGVFILLAIKEICIFFWIIRPTLAITPQEMFLPTLFVYGYLEFVSLFIIYKLIKGLNWARIATLFSNALLLIVLYLYLFLEAYWINFMPLQEFIGLAISSGNEMGVDNRFTVASSTIQILFIGSVLWSSIVLIFNQKISEWFRFIKQQTPLRKRAKKFVKGFSIYILFGLVVSITYQAIGSKYVEQNGYDSMPVSILPLSPDELSFTASVQLIMLIIIWAGYFIINGFSTIFSSKKQDTVKNDNFSKQFNIDNNAAYARAYKEIENYDNADNKTEKNISIKNQSLWAKAFAQSDGNLSKQKSIYVKLRAQELNESDESDHQENVRDNQYIEKDYKKGKRKIYLGLFIVGYLVFLFLLGTSEPNPKIVAFYAINIGTLLIAFFIYSTYIFFVSLFKLRFPKWWQIIFIMVSLFFLVPAGLEKVVSDCSIHNISDFKTCLGNLL